MPALTREQLAARRATRRQRERRRRNVLLALALLPIAAAAALAAAIASGSGDSRPLPISSQAREQVPDPVPDRRLSPDRAPEDVTLARGGGVALKLPVPRDLVTAVVFHASESPSPVALDPQGGVGYEIAPRRGRPGPEAAAMDVGAVAGTTVYSPVDGVVASVDDHSVFGRSAGYEMLIAPAGAAGLLVRLTHLEDPRRVAPPGVGQPVRAGRTVVGRVADFSGIARQEVAAFTNDSGNHVHVEIVRAGLELAP